jgi:hypothetical protein
LIVSNTRFDLPTNKFPTAEKQVFYNIWAELVDIRELLEKLVSRPTAEGVTVDATPEPTGKKYTCSECKAEIIGFKNFMDHRKEHRKGGG